MRNLWPPLTVIESDLFTPSDGLIQRWSEGDPSLSKELVEALEADPEACARREALREAERMTVEISEGPREAPLMSPALQEMIRRRVDARQAKFSSVPTSGQILRVDEVRGPQGPLGWDLPRPLAVLISEPDEETEQVWYGWLVTSETDYASYWDLLLGPEDEPCDPLARMIQLWNPVYVYIPSTSMVLAELKPQRLAAVRALAVECATAPEPDPAQARPGEIISRQAGPYPIRTGTPLGGKKDPRRRYQDLYFDAAEALKEPAALAAEAAAPASRLSAATVLDWIAAQFKDWAAEGRARLEPFTPIAQPMGIPTEAPALYYEWEELLRLTLTVDEANNILLMHLALIGDRDLKIRLVKDNETVRTAHVQPEAREVDLFIDYAHKHHLVIADREDQELFRMPIPKLP